MWITYGAFYLNRLNLPVVFPSLKTELNLTYTQVAFIGSSLMITYMIAQLPSGLLSDKLGPRKVITIGSLIIVFSNLLFGFSKNYEIFILAQFFNGFGQGMGWSPSIKLLANLFSKRERGTTIGLFLTSVPAFSALAYIFSGYLTVNFGWRSAFYTPAIILLAIIGAFWFAVKKNESKYVLNYNFPKKDYLGRIELMRILSNINVWMAAISFSTILFVEYGFNMWIPSFLVEDVKLPLEEAVLIASATPAGGVVGGPLGGFISDKLLKGKRKPVIVLTLAILLASTLMLIYLKQNLVFLALSLILAGFCIQASGGLFFAYIADALPLKLTGSGAGFLETIGHAAAVIAIYGVGFLVDLYGSYAYAFLVFSLVSILGFLTSIKMNEKA
jgi:sugar phosphate permease